MWLNSVYDGNFVVMSWSERILRFTRQLNTPLKLPDYLEFFVDGSQCGMIHKDYLHPFSSSPDIFQCTTTGVTLLEKFENREDRSRVVNDFFARLRDEGVFSHTLKGWRDETYSVFRDGFKSDVLFDIERAAVPILGCKSYGVHLNGFVRMSDGSMKMWLGKRSLTKAKYPGYHDNVVAGGISSGYGVWDTLVKEADEEAGMGLEYLSGVAVPAGCISYTVVNQYGTSPEVEFVYDVELPQDFVPHNKDGEVAGEIGVVIIQVMSQFPRIHKN